jgi:hypothetical protein
MRTIEQGFGGFFSPRSAPDEPRPRDTLYWFIDQRAWIGGEYLYGRRELRSGVHGSDNRIQLATRFNILK